MRALPRGVRSSRTANGRSSRPLALFLVAGLGLASPAVLRASPPAATVPSFHAAPGLEPEVEPLAARAWSEIARLLAAEGVPLPPSPRPVRIVPAGDLGPAEAGASRPGVIALRRALPLSGTGGLALRHEVAHQLLLEACPAASRDRLFHEAFAVAASGELSAWAAGEEGGPYLSLTRAVETLARARSLDGPAARRALARLLAEAPARPGRLPEALARPLSRCEAGSTWIPLRPEDLAGGAPAGDALAIVSRHTGEVLLAEGAASVPLPFGSALKPFLVAGAGQPPPALVPDPSRPGWRCGPDLPGRIDAATALLRSCNGWFLDWAALAPGVITFGRWGPALRALGLSAMPREASEAIGVRPTLRISSVGLAQAYRLLAEARPDLMDVLSRNAREGTLAGLPASAALAGVALKTGTVLDAEARPRLGVIAAVDRDLVAVMARTGKAPRAFAGELAAALARARSPAREAARVQVLGLLPPDQVEARCQGTGFTAGPAGPEPTPAGFAPAAPLARRGPLVCVGAPWLLRYPGLAAPRPYAGVLSFDPPASASRTEPAHPGRAAPEPTPREARARRGSELVLRTTRLAYAAGVVSAEDAALRGEARVALARVADANGAHGHLRHPGRPPCDTTHCQAFRGTASPRLEERAALAEPIAPRGWLPFAQGGQAPWAAERSAAEVAAVLGPGARDLGFADGRVSFVTLGGDPSAPYEERRSLPCELLRGPLKLPACPARALLLGGRVRFEGRGEGHGEGLELEWAKRSGLSAREILERAYGRMASSTAQPRR